MGQTTGAATAEHQDPLPAGQPPDHPVEIAGVALPHVVMVGGPQGVEPPSCPARAGGGGRMDEDDVGRSLAGARTLGRPALAWF